MGLIDGDHRLIARRIRARAWNAGALSVYVLLMPSGAVRCVTEGTQRGDQLLARYPERLVGAYRGLLPASDIRADLECALRELMVRRAA
ncbi:MAG: hypothetical protein KGL35_32475 [Bradyrhizobium sp.]|nr:hypothetical protein [Bradyrhizobium sp.]